MAFCKNCGKQIPDDKNLCSECDTTITNTTPEQIPQPSTNQPQKQESTNSKTTLGLIIGLVIICILIIIVFIVIVVQLRKTFHNETASTENTAMVTMTEELQSTTEETIAEATTEEVTEATTETATEAPGTKQLAADVIKDIQSWDSYEELDNLDLEPLALFADVNDDGNDDLLVLYTARNQNNVLELNYQYYTYQNDKFMPIYGDALYVPLSGSNGYVGISKRDGNYYLSLYVSEHVGQAFTQKMYYIPFHPSSSNLLYNDVETMDGNGSSGDETNGTYHVNGAPASYDEYRNAYRQYDWIYKLDFTEGPSGEVMTFDDLLNTLK